MTQPHTPARLGQHHQSLVTRFKVQEGFIHEGEVVVGRFDGFVNLTPTERYFTLVDTDNKSRYFASETTLEMPIGQPIVVTSTEKGVEVKTASLPNVVSYQIDPNDWRETYDEDGNINAAHSDGKYLILSDNDRHNPELFTLQQDKDTGRMRWDKASNPFDSGVATLDEAKAIVTKRANYWRSIICDCPVCAAKGRKGKIVEGSISYECENRRNIRFGKPVKEENKCKMMPLYKEHKGAKISRSLAKEIFETGASAQMVRCVPLKGDSYEMYILFDRLDGIVAFSKHSKPAGERGLRIDPNGVPPEIHLEFEDFMTRLQQRNERCEEIKKEVTQYYEEIVEANKAGNLAIVYELRQKVLLATSELGGLQADRNTLFEACKQMSHCTIVKPDAVVTGRLENKIETSKMSYAVILDLTCNLRLVPWRDGMDNHMGNGICVRLSEDEVSFVSKPIIIAQENRNTQ